VEREQKRQERQKFQAKKAEERAAKLSQNPRGKATRGGEARRGAGGDKREQRSTAGTYVAS